MAITELTEEELNFLENVCDDKYKENPRCKQCKRIGYKDLSDCMHS